MVVTMSPTHRRKRIPQLTYTKNRGIGWHVSYRDATSGLPRKHRFGDITEEIARALYHQWVADHLNGKTTAPPTPGPKLTRLETPKQSAMMVMQDVTPGSVMHVAGDLLRFDEARTREDGAPRTQRF